MSSKAFLKVLNDNIVACHQAEYYNKAKLFQFIKQIIKEEMKKSTETRQGGSSIPTNEGEVEEDITGAKYGLNVYHAPQFVEHKNDEIYGDVEVRDFSLFFFSSLLILLLITFSPPPPLFLFFNESI